VRWTPPRSLFSVRKSLLERHARTFAILGEIEKILYFDAEAANKVNEFLRFGPCPVQFIVGNLSCIYAYPRCKLLAAQVQRIPQFFNSKAE
jgi:hypothetical protein